MDEEQDWTQTNMLEDLNESRQSLSWLVQDWERCRDSEEAAVNEDNRKKAISFGAEEKKLKIDGDNSSSLLMTCSPHTVIGWWCKKTNIPINYAQVWLDSAGSASKESSKELDFPWPGKTFVGGGDGEQISI